MDMHIYFSFNSCACSRHTRAAGHKIRDYMDLNYAFCDDPGIYNMGIIKAKAEKERIDSKNATLKYVKI